MGIAGKVRPCLLLTDYPTDDELALVTVIPHTTALRGNRWEVAIPKSFLQPGAFHLQQLQTVSLVRLLRRLGALDGKEMEFIEAALTDRLQL
jgi:mRNA interferase MazF